MRLSSLARPALRPYQQQCVDTCLMRYQQGIRKQIVSLPVGSGKTVVLSTLLRSLPPPNALATKSLVLAHRDELLQQAYAQIQTYCDGLNVQMEQAHTHADVHNADVIVASVQSLSRQSSGRLLKYDPRMFKCVLIDEAHHATASTYLRIVDHFRPNPDLLFWGCSATVERHDAVALGSVFEEVSFQLDTVALIKEGWLCDARATTVRTTVDIDDVRTTRSTGDFDLKQLSHIVNTPERNRLVVETWQREALPKGVHSTLVFAADVKHVMDLKAMFQEYNYEAVAVTGRTKRHDRRSTLEAFRSRQVPVMINCGIYTEGTDIPAVDCILMARPTKSSVLFQQMLGRGLRLYPGKQHCLVIDFVDNCGRNDRITVPTLLGLNPDEVLEDVVLSEQDPEAMTFRPPKKQEEVQTKTESVVEKRDWTLFSQNMRATASPLKIPFRSSLAWINLYDGRYIINLLRNRQIMVCRDSEHPEHYTAKILVRIQQTRKVIEKKLDIQAETVDRAIKSAETLLGHRKDLVNVGRGYVQGASSMLRADAKWRGQKVSVAQVSFLKRLGVRKVLGEDVDTLLGDLTKGDAERVIVLLQFKKYETLKRWMAKHEQECESNE